MVIHGIYHSFLLKRARLVIPVCLFRSLVRWAIQVKILLGHLWSTEWAELVALV